MELGNIIFGNHPLSGKLYPIERTDSFRNKAGKVWNELLDTVNCDDYGVYMGKNKNAETKTGGFRCDLFEINPYYWGDCDCGAEDENHKETCSTMIPNFILKVEGCPELKIQWYKYPFRDAYCNMDLSEDDFKEIFLYCLEYANQHCTEKKVSMDDICSLLKSKWNAKSRKFDK